MDNKVQLNTVISCLDQISASIRSNHQEVFLGKGILKIYSKFIGEYSCQSAILIKFICNFIQITLRDGCSSVDFLHSFGTPFLKNTSGWLLLIHVLKIYILMVSNAKNLKVNGHVDIKTKSVFCLDVWHIQRRSENPVKHVRWSFFSCKKSISNFKGQYKTFFFNKNHQKYANITP